MGPRGPYAGGPYGPPHHHSFPHSAPHSPMASHRTSMHDLQMAATASRPNIEALMGGCGGSASPSPPPPAPPSSLPPMGFREFKTSTSASLCLTEATQSVEPRIRPPRTVGLVGANANENEIEVAVVDDDDEDDLEEEREEEVPSPPLRHFQKAKPLPEKENKFTSTLRRLSTVR